MVPAISWIQIYFRRILNMKFGICVILVVLWTYTLAYDRDCPVQSKVKCNYKYDVPCSSTSDCERKGRRNQICCPDEGGHPVCTPRRPGTCPFARTRHCRASNIVKTACSKDKDCPLPAKCCMNSKCRNYCEFNPVLGRGYRG